MESQKINNIALSASTILRACVSTNNEGICKPIDMPYWYYRTKIRYWMLHLYFEVFWWFLCIPI